MPWHQSHFPQKILTTAQNLAVDLTTAEVVSALRGERIDSILLKGPTFARWLYRDTELRTYVDVDLLIAPGAGLRAGEVLLGLGFIRGFETGDGASLPGRVLFVRPPDEVDLHHTLQGVQVDEQRVWSVLSALTERQEVAGEEVAILAEPARALHVALHAAQHGRDWDVPMEDLARALAMLPFETWEAAGAESPSSDAGLRDASFASGSPRKATVRHAQTVSAAHEHAVHDASRPKGPAWNGGRVCLEIRLDRTPPARWLSHLDARAAGRER
jgi:hypothetical protein